MSSETGFRATSRSPQLAIQELGDARNRLYDDPDLRLRMGHACRERANRDFSWETFGEQMTERYREITSAPGGGHP